MQIRNNLALSGSSVSLRQYTARKNSECHTLQSSPASNKISRPATDAVQDGKEDIPFLNAIRRVVGDGKNEYSYLADGGAITYHGVTFSYDSETGQMSLGDVSDPRNCIRVPLSGGGSLIFNRNSIGSLSKAIGLFSPEDTRRILDALSQDAKCRQAQAEIEETEASLLDNSTEHNARTDSH